VQGAHCSYDPLAAVTPDHLIWCAEVGVKATTRRILKIAYTRQSKTNFHGLQEEKGKKAGTFMAFSLHDVQKRAMYLAHDHDIRIRGHVSTNTTFRFITKIS
jgi:hypothetical protein